MPNKFIGATTLAILLITQLSWAVGPRTNTASQPIKRAVKAQPADDANQPPPDEPSAEEDASPPDTNIEYSTEPNDVGIEYADEAERKEHEQAEKKAQEEQKLRAQKRHAPPTDEPMPLIRRERDVVEFPNKLPPKRIRHPNAAKGLTKITRDKIYIYKVKPSDQTKASSFRIGIFTPKLLKNKSTGVYYTDLYKPNSPMLLYDYEWQIARRFGKLGIKVGTGLAIGSGNGRFKDPNITGNLQPKERFSFVMFPNSAGLVYRFQYMDKQILVPYVDGGGTVFTFGEFRDDNKPPKGGAALGAYAAAGISLSLNFLDQVAMLELDREYSINSVYFTAEMRTYAGFGNFIFSSNVINGGVLVEF